MSLIASLRSFLASENSNPMSETLLMRTEDLIRGLAKDLKAVPSHPIGRRITLGVVAGGFIALVALATTIGVRPDFWQAIQGFAFWMKLAYAVSLGLAATMVAADLARPEAGRPWRMLLLTVPLMLLAGISVVQLAHAPGGDWRAMWLGNTWPTCPLTILLLSVPIFACLVWSFRRLAPTRLRVAGAAADLAAGAWAATLYCLHCPEVSAAFVLTWYSLAIASAGGVGALLGSRLLHW